MVLFIFQTQIAKAFTNDEKVISAVTNVMWLIALMQISDAMNANSAGCLRGQGQTKIGGIVNLFSIMLWDYHYQYIFHFIHLERFFTWSLDR